MQQRLRHLSLILEPLSGKRDAITTLRGRQHENSEPHNKTESRTKFLNFAHSSLEASPLNLTHPSLSSGVGSCTEDRFRSRSNFHHEHPTARSCDPIGCCSVAPSRLARSRVLHFRPPEEMQCITLQTFIPLHIRPSARLSSRAPATPVEFSSSCMTFVRRRKVLRDEVGNHSPIPSRADGEEMVDCGDVFEDGGSATGKRSAIGRHLETKLEVLGIEGAFHLTGS